MPWSLTPQEMEGPGSIMEPYSLLWLEKGWKRDRWSQIGGKAGVAFTHFCPPLQLAAGSW